MCGHFCDSGNRRQKNRVTSENIRIHTPSPLPSIQSWDVSCFLKVARTVAQHCMKGKGEETLSFPLLKSGKRQKAHLGRSVSTHFVIDCSLTMSFWKLGKKNKRTKKLSLTSKLSILLSILLLLQLSPAFLLMTDQQIIDVAVPGDAKVALKEKEKIDKYQDLAKELRKLWKVKTRVVPIVNIRALRTIPIKE